MKIPPREVFAAEARSAVARHAEWDSPHAFVTYTWDGEKLLPRTYACIVLDMPPAVYPKLMADLAAKDFAQFHGEAPYAYGLYGEAYGVPEPGPGATERERALYRADQQAYTFHLRADAIEVAVARIADIHGRLWEAQKRRDLPDEINEGFFRPGYVPQEPEVQALLSCAATARAIGHGTVPAGFGVN